MKNNLVSLLYAAFLFVFPANGQTTVQGTAVDLAAVGFPNSARVAGKPNITINSVLFGNINVTVSILDQGGANPTEGQIGKTLAIPSLDLVTPVGNPYIFGGRAYYSYILIANANPATTTWLANTNNTIMDLSFPAPVSSYGMRLEDVSPSGGPNGQMYWYVQITGQGDITNYNEMFYGTPGNPPTNNGGAAPSFVPLQNYSVLPVRFLNFTVTKTNYDALLNWHVTNEGIITDRYEVERSLNGSSFQKIATVEKNIISNSSNSYVFTDPGVENHFNNSGGRIYYRIKQIDKDGRFIYSDIKSIKTGKAGEFKVSLYPNPVRSEATISVDLPAAADINIWLTDATGKTIQQINLIGTAGENIKKINMANYAGGIYYLKIQAGNETKAMQVFKTN